MEDELNQIYRELGLRNLLTELGINANAMYSGNDNEKVLFYNANKTIPLADGLLDLNIGIQGDNINVPYFKDSNLDVNRVGISNAPNNPILGGLLELIYRPELQRQEEEFLLNYIKKNNLKKKIFLVGYVENLFPVMNQSKGFILSSLWEDTGFVLI